MINSMNILSSPIVQALGWTVLHSLWIGVVVALILSIAFNMSQKKSAAFHYHLSFAALLGFMLSVIACFVCLADNIQSVDQELLVPAAVSQNTLIENPHFNTVLDQEFINNSIDFADQYLGFIVMVWLIGMVLFLFKTIIGFCFLSKLRKTAQFHIPLQWQKYVDKMAYHLNINKSIQLAESALVKVPSVLGYFKPIILLPIGFINGLDPKETEAILAHEISHIARNDFFFNIIQILIESVLYFHPATWWISSKIRTERENACDDMALALTKCSVSYAKALVSINQQHSDKFALALGFAGKNSKLLNRVKRVLDQSQNNTRIMEKIITSTLLLSLITVVSIGSSWAVVEPEQTNSPIENISAELKKNNQLVYQDTIPDFRRNVEEIEWRSGGQNIQIYKEDGQVTKLWVDGERIPQEEIYNYKNLIASFKAPEKPVAPQPPAPPAKINPPVRPVAPSAPTSKISGPSSPTAPAPPAPPAAPAPPAPPVPPVHPEFPIKKSGLGTIEWKNRSNKLGHEIQKQFELAEIKNSSLEDFKNADEFKVMLNKQLKELDKNKKFVVSNYENFPSAHENESRKFVYKIKPIESKKPIDKNEFKTAIDSIKPDFENFEIYIKDLDKLEDAIEEFDFDVHSEAFENAFEDFDFDEHSEAILNAIKGTDFDLESFIDEEELRESLRDAQRHFESFSGDHERLGKWFENELGNVRISRAFSEDCGSRSTDIKERIEAELLEDQLISSTDNYSFRLNSKNLKIDGRKMAANIYLKYKSIYEKYTGSELKKGNVYEVVKKSR